MRGFRWKIAGVLGLVLALWFAPIPEAHAVESHPQTVDYTISYQGDKGSPSGLVQASSPIVSYYMKLSNYDLNYDIEMYINGEEVDASYSEETGMLTYQANRLSGRNVVTIRVYVQGSKQLEKAWSFEVDDRQLNPFETYDRSTLDEVEQEAIQKANEYRTQLNEPPLSQNEQLQQAAQAHANYMATYDTGHSEEQGNQDLYTGERPQQRADFFGYPNWYVGEGITYQEPSGDVAINHLFDAPYHRLSIMNPFYTEAGAGYNHDGDVVMNFGGTGSQGDHRIVQYPYGGQEEVPVSWFAYESPNPLRFFNQDQIWTGYPVSYVYYGPRADQLNVSQAILMNEKGEEVPTYTVTPSMEEDRKHHVFLIPKEKLTPGETYTASIEATVSPQEGTSFDASRRWSFTTGDEIAFDKIYFEEQKGVQFLTLEWSNGEDPNAQVTLKKDGELYLKKKGNSQQNRQAIEASGVYQMTVDSPHFESTKTIPVQIQTGNTPRYDKGSPLDVVGYGATAEPRQRIHDSYPVWKSKETMYTRDKEWTIEFNSQIKRDELSKEMIYIMDPFGNKLTPTLQRDAQRNEVIVLPPEDGYEPGDYTLVIEPLENIDGLEMESGVQMPFSIGS